MQQDRLSGKSLIILGDSYSTFAGCVPEGQDIYYPNEGLGVTEAAHTWWRQLIDRHGMTLVSNDSWSGATVCTSVRPEHPESAAFVARMETTLNGDYQPDLVILFGGTNDCWTDCPLGDMQLSGWTREGDKAVLPAFCHMLSYVKDHNPASRILCVVNCDLGEALTAGILRACEAVDVPSLLLRDIDKEWGHPTRLGMTQIADQIENALQ